jgi:two-component system chemotaxis response regulator CheY
MPEEEFVQFPWLRPAGKLLKPYSVEELLGTVKRVLREANTTTDGLLRFRPHDARERQVSQTEGAIGPTRLYLSNPPSRILVVDDNSDTRQLSVDVLSGSGYDVEAVLDGAAGWEALQSTSYDLIITDNKMPRMTGLEMIEKLRSARMTLPVIMATGHLPLNEFARRPWLKPDAMLQRPFSTDDLLETVKTVLHPGNDNGGGKASPFPQYF